MSNETNTTETPTAPAVTPPAPPTFRTERRILYLFTRTPLHVGAGASVGAIDQPIQRERHTGFPIIPGSTLKGVFADERTEIYDEPLKDEKGQSKKDAAGNRLTERRSRRKPDGLWLFGKESNADFAAGAIQFGEARLLAFPIRSAKGSFAWVTCPLILKRAARDGIIDRSLIPQFPTPASGQPDNSDEVAFFAANGPLALGDKIVLEEYTFTRTGSHEAADLGAEMEKLLADPVWQEVIDHLVILSNGMMTFFATTACEVTQHVRIEDVTGTADGGGLFNQENVPSETLFYAPLHAFSEFGKHLKTDQDQSRPPRTATEAIREFWPKPAETRLFQFGADATTGLGQCTVRLHNPASSLPGAGSTIPPPTNSQALKSPAQSSPADR